MNFVIVIGNVGVIDSVASWRRVVGTCEVVLVVFNDLWVITLLSKITTVRNHVEKTSAITSRVFVS